MNKRQIDTQMREVFYLVATSESVLDAFENSKMPVSRRTFYNWLADPTLKKEFELIKKEIIDQKKDNISFKSIITAEKLIEDIKKGKLSTKDKIELYKILVNNDINESKKYKERAEKLVNQVKKVVNNEKRTITA